MCYMHLGNRILRMIAARERLGVKQVTLRRAHWTSSLSRPQYSPERAAANA
jgi:hypothetical protein